MVEEAERQSRAQRGPIADRYGVATKGLSSYFGVGEGNTNVEALVSAMGTAWVRGAGENAKRKLWRC